MSANISAVIPSSILGGLHKTRIEGASMEQLRVQLADLRDQTLELQRENNQLATRFALDEQQSTQVIQRVGALEVSLPRLLEAAAQPVSQVDRSVTTSSIGDDGATSFEADGGSVTVRQRPMAELAPAPVSAPAEQAMPPLVPTTTAVATIATPNPAAYAVSLGSGVSSSEAPAAWSDLTAKLGPLLLGLTPRLSGAAADTDRRLLAGPITQLSEATALCARLERVSIACSPVPFTGTPLAD